MIGQMNPPSHLVNSSAYSPGRGKNTGEYPPVRTSLGLARPAFVPAPIFKSLQELLIVNAGYR